MKCTQAILLLEREGRRKTPTAEKRRLVKHLRECPECAAYRDCCRVMAETLAELRRPQLLEKAERVETPAGAAGNQLSVWNH